MEDIKQRLLKATGFQGSPELTPTIKLQDSQKRGASYNSQTRTIEIDLVAYEICEGFYEHKEAALAFIIGHELGHFYYKSLCGNGLGMVDGAQRMQEYMLLSSEVERTTELRADYFGILAAHLAGYDALMVLDGLMGAFHDKYPFMANSYPDVDARKEVNNIFQRKCTELVRLYELATLLQVSRQFKKAANCYATIKKYFNCPEVLNNLAICRLQLALAFYDQQAFFAPTDVASNWRLAYAFEIDPNFRLFGERTRSTPGSNIHSLQQQLITEVRAAQEGLNEAIRLNPTYASGILNKAWASLLESLANSRYELITNKDLSVHPPLLDAALQLAEKAQKLAHEQQREVTAYNAKLCYLLAKSKKIGVDKTINELQSLGSFATPPIDDYAKTNLAIITNKLNIQEAKYKLTEREKQEIVRQIFSQCQQGKTRNYSSITLQGQKLMLVEKWCVQGSFLEYSYGPVLQFQKPYNGQALATSSREFNKGTDVVYIKDHFGAPTYAVPTNKGAFWIYKQNRLILEIEGGQLKQWWIMR